MLESYEISDSGYHPFLIREGWQVAKLNFMEEQRIENINIIECHQQTDEVFVLLKGTAVLILAKFKNGIPVFEVSLMKSGAIYNIPVNSWHNIAMEEGSEVLIVEKSNTHIEDVSYRDLTQHQITELRIMVKKVLK